MQETDAWGKGLAIIVASYQADLFNQLEEDGVRYAITADQDKAVKR